MRFVDTESFQTPNGWLARADRALVELRAEIAQAEATARAAGQDVALARKAAITAGLNLDARKQLWRELDAGLAALSNGNCWYSESRNPTADKNIDHFRPQKGVTEDPAHEGYWWLAFAWRNYQYSSQWCNQRRVDDIHGTNGGKSNHFPLNPGGFRARQENDDIDLEEPDLLDPVDPADWKLLTFRADGQPTEAKPPGTRDFDRAQKSIRVYHLDCWEMVKDRRILAGKVLRIIQDLETLRPKLTDRKLLAVYKRQEIELLRAIRSGAEYSAAALAYVRGGIYTIKDGNQAKREWLEEILGVNP